MTSKLNFSFTPAKISCTIVKKRKLLKMSYSSFFGTSLDFLPRICTHTHAKTAFPDFLQKNNLLEKLSNWRHYCLHTDAVACTVTQAQVMLVMYISTTVPGPRGSAAFFGKSRREAVQRSSAQNGHEPAVEHFLFFFKVYSCCFTIKPEHDDIVLQHNNNIMI